MIPQGFLHLRPISCSAGSDSLRLRPGKCSFEPHGEVVYPRAEESSVRRVDGSAWGWRQVACRLVFLLVIASVTYLYVHGAAAFYRTFNQPISLGSECEAMASVNRSIL